MRKFQPPGIRRGPMIVKEVWLSMVTDVQTFHSGERGKDDIRNESCKSDSLSGILNLISLDKGELSSTSTSSLKQDICDSYNVLSSGVRPINWASC